MTHKPRSKLVIHLHCEERNQFGEITVLCGALTGLADNRQIMNGMLSNNGVVECPSGIQFCASFDKPIMWEFRDSICPKCISTLKQFGTSGCYWDEDGKPIEVGPEVGERLRNGQYYKRGDEYEHRSSVGRQ